MTATTKHLSDADHAFPVISEQLVSELQELRKVIPHAALVGAQQTNISIELLEVLLAAMPSVAVRDTNPVKAILL